MFRRLLPKEVCFFEYFEKHAELTIEACKAFLALTQGAVEGRGQTGRIKELEHEADDLTHKCIEELNKTFITPIDRVDIHQLIKRLDDIVDAVDASASRLTLYELVEVREEARQLAEVLVKATTEIAVALKQLRKIGEVGAIKSSLIRIHQYENDGDTILRAALARLFKEEDHRPILVIKWKEIFERLERATDRCEEVANIIEKIVIEAS
jgi:predicted phosphate transport protein (TIGR00153 family)